MRYMFHETVSSNNFFHTNTSYTTVNHQSLGASTNIVASTHIQRRRHQQFFLDNSEISINMKQTNRNRNIRNTSKLQQGHLP